MQSLTVNSNWRLSSLFRPAACHTSVDIRTTAVIMHTRGRAVVSTTALHITSLRKIAAVDSKNKVGGHTDTHSSWVDDIVDWCMLAYKIWSVPNGTLSTWLMMMMMIRWSIDDSTLRWRAGQSTAPLEPFYGSSWRPSCVIVQCFWLCRSLSL